VGAEQISRIAYDDDPRGLTIRERPDHDRIHRGKRESDRCDGNRERQGGDDRLPGPSHDRANGQTHLERYFRDQSTPRRTRWSLGFGETDSVPRPTGSVEV